MYRGGGAFVAPENSRYSMTFKLNFGTENRQMAA